MKNLQLEKKLIKLDKDIEALGLAKKYLSNGEEIEKVKVDLNKERQLLVSELYAQDKQARQQCIDLIQPMLNLELRQAQQVALLDEIKMIFGRRFPEVSKNSHGLNAWLSEIGVACTWATEENSDWATLVMTGFSAQNV